jgi:hypothetical protein
MRLGLTLKRTPPYWPQTNGNAERVIQMLLRECTYVTRYSHFPQRAQALRPGCAATTPIALIALLATCLLQSAQRRAGFLRLALLSSPG